MCRKFSGMIEAPLQCQLKLAFLQKKVGGPLLGVGPQLGPKQGGGVIRRKEEHSRHRRLLQVLCCFNFFFKRLTPFFLLRHLPFPVGAVSRYLVTASAPCCLPSMVLRAWDVRGNK